MHPQLRILNFYIQIIVLTFFYSVLFSQVPGSDPNIILIYVDDLNDYTETMQGHPQVETPNLTALASRGVAFMNAYATSPGCAPSRVSTLTGKEAEYTKIYNNTDYITQFRMNFSAATNNETVFTIPELLKNSGKYFTYSISKIFHGNSENDYDNSSSEICSKSQSWNKMSVYEESEEFAFSASQFAGFSGYNWGIIPDSLEKDLEDVRNIDTAIQFIQDVSSGTSITCGKPFFLALGLRRPHTPRMLPEKYFLPYYQTNISVDGYTTLYNTSQIDTGYNGVVMPPQPATRWADYFALPAGGIARSIADAGSLEPTINNYLLSQHYLPVVDSTKTLLENYDLLLEDQRAKFVMGYLAAVKYIDTQIGRLLDSLASYPDVYNNTIIILTSDHGFSLGEKKHYTKWALWDTDIRVPLIFAGPGISSGGIVHNTVSLLDLMPTICDITNVAIPNMPDGTTYADGTSFKALLSNTNANWYKPALSSYIKTTGKGSCTPHYSVRHDGYHYIRYRKNNNSGKSSPCDPMSTSYEEELYQIGNDREIDPYEWNNLANDPKNAPIIDYLETFLPDNYNYLQSSMRADINILSSLPCMLTRTGKILMKPILYSNTGVQLSNAALKNYTYTWTNSATSITKVSINYTFNLASIPLSYYDNNASIRFYLTVKNKITGNIVAVKMIELALNPSKTPVIDFTPQLENHTLSIEAVSISDTYKSVAWDFGDTYTSNLFTPLKHIYQNGGDFTISQSVNYGNACSITNSKTVYIHYDTIALCEGSNYTLSDGTEIGNAGNYLNTLISQFGYDSVVILTALQNPLSYSDNTFTICAGDAVLLPDSTQVFEAGTYVTTLTNYLGCDSVITTIVEIIPESISENTMAMCAGNAVLLPDSTEVFEAGTYVTTLTNYLGCDSVITTIVELIPESISENTMAMCAGNAVLLPDSTQVFEAGTYVTTLTNYLGCDSVITTIVEIFPQSITDTVVFITEGESYTLPDGTTTIDTGTYYFSAPDINGCDSIINSYIFFTDTVEMRLINSSIHILPNPVKGNLYITRNPIKSNTDIQLYNLNGQLLATYIIIPEEISIEIPMHNYAASLYVIRVSENGVAHMFTVIKIE